MLNKCLYTSMWYTFTSASGSGIRARGSCVLPSHSRTRRRTLKRSTPRASNSKDPSAGEGCTSTSAAGDEGDDDGYEVLGTTTNDDDDVSDVCHDSGSSCCTLSNLDTSARSDVTCAMEDLPPTTINTTTTTSDSHSKVNRRNQSLQHDMTNIVGHDQYQLSNSRDCLDGDQHESSAYLPDQSTFLTSLSEPALNRDTKDGVSSACHYDRCVLPYLVLRGTCVAHNTTWV